MYPCSMVAVPSSIMAATTCDAKPGPESLSHAAKNRNAGPLTFFFALSLLAASGTYIHACFHDPPVSGYLITYRILLFVVQNVTREKKKKRVQRPGSQGAATSRTVKGGLLGEGNSTLLGSCRDKYIRMLRPVIPLPQQALPLPLTHFFLVAARQRSE